MRRSRFQKFSDNMFEMNARENARRKAAGEFDSKTCGSWRSPNSDNDCGSNRHTHWCIRDKGHKGKHRAASGDTWAN